MAVRRNANGRPCRRRSKRAGRRMERCVRMGDVTGSTWCRFAQRLGGVFRRCAFDGGEWQEADLREADVSGAIGDRAQAMGLRRRSERNRATMAAFEEASRAVPGG